MYLKGCFNISSHQLFPTLSLSSKLLLHLLKFQRGVFQLGGVAVDAGVGELGFVLGQLFFQGG